MGKKKKKNLLQKLLGDCFFKNTSRGRGLGEDKAEGIGGWNQACIYSKLLSV